MNDKQKEIDNNIEKAYEIILKINEVNESLELNTALRYLWTAQHDLRELKDSV